MLGLGIGSNSVFNGITGVYNTTTNTSAMHFPNAGSGAGDYLTLADHDDFSHLDNPFSVACWVKRDGNNNDGLYAKGQYDTSEVNLEYRTFWVGANLYVDKSDGGSQLVNYKRRIYNGVAGTDWTHLVITYTGGYTGQWATVYANGSPVSVSTTGGSDTDGMSNLAGTFDIGRVNETGYQLGGEVCQFIMWKDYQLTQSDVTYLYGDGEVHRDPTIGTQDYSGSSKVLLWLPLQSDANDSSGNGHDMAVGGNAAVSSSSVPF